ncbi:MAG: L-threonylcarbamoyladenylate synthase [Patescibacteria group bacterium]|nr:L-threonylcarbamoyladenylate synthase [Patescibacteria group bacterium]
MKIFKLTKKNQKEAIKITLKILKNDGLVVFPSDTVYGLLTEATNERAVKKLINFKNRPPGKPISVFLSDFSMIDDYVFINKNQKNILKKLLPGPFTIILKSKNKVCSLIESEKKTLGIRIPDFSLILELVKNFKKPITATSANISGHSPHYRVESLLKQLSDKKKELIDLIVNAGVLPRNKPSTIIDITEDNFKILRKGDIVFSDEKTFYSKTPTQTKKIASYFLKKLNFSFDKPLIFILKAEMGAGKTVFVKGMAQFFGIKKIISPSFVIFYEYKLKNQKINNFIHFDFYNIQEEEEINDLKINDYLKPGNILAIEWGEKAGSLMSLFKNKAKIVFIEIEYVSEKERKIKISY